MKPQRATLFSLMGRGRRDQGSATTYEKTTYAIGDELIESPFFVHAILKSKRGRDVDEVVLLGTPTSTWGALVEEFATEDAELFTELEVATDQGPGKPARGVTAEQLGRLSERLSAVWSRRVSCIAVPDTVDDASAPAIASMFLARLPIADPHREVLFDITHGFRTLPVIGLAAIQLADAIAPGFVGRTRVLYGELPGKPARGLEFPELQVLSAVSAEVRLFLDTLDGEKLAARVKTVSPSLGGAIEALSAVAMTNSLRALGESVRRMKNALDRPGTGEPEWLRLVRDRLQQLLTDMPAHDGPDQLVALADWRFQRGQTALAILTLSEAVAFLASPAEVEDFQALTEAGEQWSLEEIREYQFRQLRAVLLQAASHSRFYQQRFAEAAFRRGDFADSLD